MRPLTAIPLTASLALAFFVVSNTPAFAQAVQVQENVIVTTPPPVVKGSLNDHFLSFNGPVAIPGVTLGPGSYIFRRPADTNGSVMQVLSADRRHAYAMFHTLPVLRAANTDKYDVVFGDARSGSPRPIKQLFLADTSIGYELIYPKADHRVSDRAVD